MNANELFRAGKLTEAIHTLSEELRNVPTDTQRRTFLFELLCFAGEFDRAEKQLSILSERGTNAELGAMLYRSALHAERERQAYFQEKAYLNHSAVLSDERGGTLNGKPFQSISDSDSRIGARLEAYVAGEYMWVPFEHIASLEMQAPKRLRDLLWSPVVVRTGPSFQDKELGEVIVPVLSPFSWSNADENVRLGRASVWEGEDGGEVPFGQKMFLVDGEEIPILELRKLEFTQAERTAQ